MAWSLWSLLGFWTWTLLTVVVGIGVPRLHAIFVGKVQPSALRADVKHGSERFQRTQRAHMNCVENLPVFAALVLTARSAGLDDSTFEVLALIVLPARIAQTLVHIASGRNRAVLARFSFFLIQLVCVFGMTVIVAAHALAR